MQIEKIADIFGRTDASNQFQKIMSAVFAGLVIKGGPRLARR